MRTAAKRKAATKRKHVRRRAAKASKTALAPPEMAATPFSFDAMAPHIGQAALGYQQMSAMVADAVRANWRTMEKAYKDPDFKPGDGLGLGPKSWFIDPFDVMTQLGYKERRSGITYDLLEVASQRLAIHQAFINRRLSQLAMFSQPAYMADGMGFDIVPKTGSKSMSPGDKEEARRIERILLDGGVGEQDPDARVRRSRWPKFVSMLMRDSYVFDGAANERVFNRYSGELEEFFPVSAKTIRPAADTRPSWQKQSQPNLATYDDAPYSLLSDDGLPTRWVQVLQGRPLVAYSDRQLGYAVRNPRTDLAALGLGLSELEMAIGTITALLETEKYQLSTFKSGTIPKGMFIFKGTDWSNDQIEALKRQWYATLRGAENAHQIPLIQYDGDVQFMSLAPNNKDMEFSSYNELLICVFCSVLGIDPEELSLAARASSTQAPFVEANTEWKIKASRDGNLKPNLRFVAGEIAQPLVDLINPDFLFRIVGLDEPSEEQKHQRLIQALSTTKSTNEVRVLSGDEPFDFSGMGDLGKMLNIIFNIPQNPTTFAGVKMLMDYQANMQAAAQEAAAQAAGEKRGEIRAVKADDPVFWDMLAKGEETMRRLLPAAMGR